MEHFGSIATWRDKTVKGDVESEADRGSERIIVDGLRAAFPDDAIMTEEHPDARPGENGRIWIVDSLDGSRNFVLGVPLFGISIGLIEHNEAKFGMIYFPVFDHLYWAERGMGAYGNGKRLSVNSESSLDQAMVSVAAIYQQGIDMALVHRIDERLRTHDAWDLNLGNLVLPLCYVAAGKYDGLVYLGACVWDVAAGILMIEEAGGLVTDLGGNPWNWQTHPGDIVAANKRFHQTMMTELLQ